MWPLSVLSPSPLHSLPSSTSSHRHLELSRKEPLFCLLLAPSQLSVFLPSLHTAAFLQVRSQFLREASCLKKGLLGPFIAIPAPAPSTSLYSLTLFHVLTYMLLTRSPSSACVVCEPQESRSPAQPIVCCYVITGHLVLCCYQSLSSLPVPTAGVFHFPYSRPHPNIPS